MKKTILVLSVILLIFLSCTTNEEDNLIILEDTSIICDNTVVYDPNFTGTACCIQRNSDLDFYSVVEYEYTTNLENAVYQWEVIYGEIQVVTGMNSNIIRITFDENFSTARLVCRSDGDMGACSEDVIITKLSEMD